MPIYDIYMYFIIITDIREGILGRSHISVTTVRKNSSIRQLNNGTQPRYIQHKINIIYAQFVEKVFSPPTFLKHIWIDMQGNKTYRVKNVEKSFMIPVP